MLPGEHVGHGLEAAVRVVGETGDVVVGSVAAEGIEHQERVEPALQVLRQHARQLDAGAVAGGLAGDQAFDGAGLGDGWCSWLQCRLDGAVLPFRSLACRTSLPLTAAHRRRLREVWRSAGWPCQDMVEVELLAAGLLERVRDADGRETLRVTDAGIAVLAATLHGNRAVRDAHEALVARVALELQRAGRIAWCGLSLRARIADADHVKGERWADGDARRVFGAPDQRRRLPAARGARDQGAARRPALRPAPRGQARGLSRHGRRVLVRAGRRHRRGRRDSARLRRDGRPRRGLRDARGAAQRAGARDAVRGRAAVRGLDGAGAGDAGAAAPKTTRSASSASRRASALRQPSRRTIARHALDHLEESAQCAGACAALASGRRAHAAARRPAVDQRRLAGRRGRCRHRARVHAGQGAEEAGAAVLGRELVPAVQPVEGDAVQPPGLRAAEQALRRRVRRWRPAGGAEARRALQGQRLSDDGAVHARGQRDHAPARRGRCAAGAVAARSRPGRRAADRCRARRRARRQDDQRQRVAHAGLPLVGGRRQRARRRGRSARRARRAGREVARPATAKRRRGCG